MRILFIILLFSLNASATNYFIKNGGNNDANGLSDANAWASLSKIKATSFAAGDTIFLKRGSVFYDSIRMQSSGSSVSPIVITYYGTGAKPLVSGFATVNDLTDSSGVWIGNCPLSVPKQNTVLINGKFYAKARFPNTGFLQANSATQNYVITTLNGTPNYTGVEAVVKQYNWVVDVSRISSQVNDTLFLASPLTYARAINYFLQNSPAFIDLPNDWTFDSSTKKVRVKSTTQPVVKYSFIDTLFHIVNKNYITIDGIDFEGANFRTIRYDTCSNIIIKNCFINYSGRDGIYPRESRFSQIKNDTIFNSLNNGIFGARNSDRMIIDSVWVMNAGNIEGLAAGSEGAGIGIYNDGDSSLIQRNRVKNIGYAGIYFEGIKGFVYNNYVDSFCLNKDDGGGLYIADNLGTAGTIVRSNIVTNGIGVSFIAPGIYADNNANGITFDSNTVFNAKKVGVEMHLAYNIIFRNNTIVDSLGTCFQIAAGGNGYNITAKNNIFYQKDSILPVIQLPELPSSANFIDSNYTFRPQKEAKRYKIHVTDYDKEAFSAAAFGYETNSVGLPSGITSTPGVLHFNATLSPVTKTFSGTYKDAKGVSYTNSIVLQPFTSALLFYSTAQTIIYPKLRGLKFIKVKNI